MKTGRSAEPDERERLERFLAWRRVGSTSRHAPGRRWLPYVAAIAWLGVAVITGALVTTLAAGARDAPARGASASRPAPVTPPTGTALSAAAHRPSGEPSSTARILPVARSDRARTIAVGHGRVRLESSAGPIARERALVTTAAGTLGRWVGHMTEVRAGKAIVRWVRSQPPAAAGARPSETERPQTR
jgi:hypothetical protein